MPQLTLSGHYCSNLFLCTDKCTYDKLALYTNGSNITLEEGVFCGPSMSFTNVYNPRALIERKDQYRDTLVKKGATLGANCTIVCGIIIGDYAFVAAGAVVTRNVKSYALMAGVPAEQVGWMSQFGEQIPLPLEGQGEYICSHTGQLYQLCGEQLTEAS